MSWYHLPYRMAHCLVCPSVNYSLSLCTVPAVASCPGEVHDHDLPTWSSHSTCGCKNRQASDRTSKSLECCGRADRSLLRTELGEKLKLLKIGKYRGLHHQLDRNPRFRVTQGASMCGGHWTFVKHSENNTRFLQVELQNLKGIF